MARLNPFILQVLHHHGIGCKISRYEHFYGRPLPTPKDLCIYGTDCIEFEIKHTNQLPSPLTPFHETYKDMRLADSPLDMSLACEFIDSACYDQVESSHTLSELIEMVRKRKMEHE